MQTRRLGRSGVLVSALALGTDNILNPTPEDESIRLIHAAIDGGINLIDTSDSYRAGEAERVIGKALRLRGKRDDVLVATKFHYPTGPGPERPRQLARAPDPGVRGLAAAAAARPHRPLPVASSRHGRAAGRDAGSARRPRPRRQGAVRRHVDLARLARDGGDHDLGAQGLVRVVSEQSPYNLLDRRIENELLPMCRRHGVGVLCWSPLAMGMLAGRYAVVGRPRGRLPGHAARRHLRRARHGGGHRRRQRVRRPGRRARATSPRCWRRCGRRTSRA